MKKRSLLLLIVLALIFDIAAIGGYILINPSSKEEEKTVDREISESQIQKICELATLECYYHNVSDWSQEAYGLFGYGAKKVWMEYDGVVRVGVKTGDIKVSKEEDDVYTVTIPAATILDKDLDEDSIYEISSDTTVLFLFNDSVNTEDRKKALANAQEDMGASAAENEMILNEARDRAKKIIERSIKAAGEAAGKNYKVRFIDVSGNE